MYILDEIDKSTSSRIVCIKVRRGEKSGCPIKTNFLGVCLLCGKCGFLQGRLSPPLDALSEMEQQKGEEKRRGRDTYVQGKRIRPREERRRESDLG